MTKIQHTGMHVIESPTTPASEIADAIGAALRLAEDVQELENKLLGSGTEGCTECDESPTGTLNQLADRAKDAQRAIRKASSSLSRIADALSL